jgi:hypothetical protein
MLGIDTKWLWVGGGVAALGGLYLLTRGGGEEAASKPGPTFFGSPGFGVQAGGVLPSGSGGGGGAYLDGGSGGGTINDLISSVLGGLATTPAPLPTATSTVAPRPTPTVASSPRVYAPGNRLDAQAVTDLYAEFLGRAPEAGVAAQWIKAGGTVADLRRALGNSDEFNIRYNAVVAANPVAGYQSGASFKDQDYSTALTYNAVQDIYQEFLGRAPEAGVAAQWLNVNGNEQNLRDALANSEEFKKRLAIVQGNA